MTGSLHSSRLPDTLVSTGWLEDNLAAPGLRVVDIRGYVKSRDVGNGIQHADYVGAREEYDAGHIPGAAYIDWTIDIVDQNNPVKAQIAAPEEFAEAMAIRGVGNDTDVVIVDHTGGHFATRLWWALRFYGHDRAAVLDGGINKWKAEDRLLTTEVPSPPRATFTPRVRPELRVEAEELLATIDSPGSRIVDARDDLQYSGAVRRTKHGGHIPSAVNISAKDLVNADGTWKSDDALRSVLASGGIAPDERVIAYCNGGVTATSILFALARTGHTSFANYDGSWNEWGERDDLPHEVSASGPAS